MQLTFRQGSYSGETISFRTCAFDFEGAEAGTDYTIIQNYAGTYLAANDVKFLSFSVPLAGMNRLSGYDPDPASPQNVCAQPTINIYQGGGGTWYADTAPHKITVPVGQKPDDWDTRYIDLYYTQVNPVQLYGATFYLYKPVTLEETPNAWSPTTQYYKIEGMQRALYTEDGAFFGAARYYMFYYVLEGIIGEFSSVFGPAFTYELSAANSHATYCPRSGGATGNYVFTAQAYQQQALYREPISDSSFLTEHTYYGRELQQFCECTYEGQKYIGIALIQTTSDGIPVSAYFAGITQKFWTARAPHINYGPSSGLNFGTGTYSDPSTGVGVPTIPGALKKTDFGPGMHIRLLSLDTGVTTLFSELWGTTNFWSQWRNIRYDPLSAICSLHVLPTQLTGTATQKLSIAMTRIDVANTIPPDRIITLDRGTIQIPEYFGNRLDYSDTKAFIYLPFIGDYPLDIMDVQGGAVSLVYHVDIATGDCIAFVVGTDRRGLQTMSKQYKGNCAFKIPVSGSDNGGAGMLSALSSMVGGTVAIAAGNVVGGAGDILGGMIEAATAKVNNSAAPSIQGSAASMGVLQPYIKIYRPEQVRPETFPQVVGDVAQIGGTVTQTSDGYPITGFVQYADAKLDIQATDAEIEEIRNILKGGIFL